MPPKKRTANGMRLRLYVAGDGPNSLAAVANIRIICDTLITPRPHLEIIDLVTHPQSAAAAGILVTPTLVRVAPLPPYKIFGDLRDLAAVQRLLQSG
jgi:circadian clock protein KaiB